MVLLFLLMLAASPVHAATAEPTRASSEIDPGRVILYPDPGRIETEGDHLTEVRFAWAIFGPLTKRPGRDD